MRGQGAAPRAGTLGSGFDTAGDRCSIPCDLIPARIIDRLADAGVHSLADWRRLGRKRHEIFGVTQRWAARLDDLARERA
jgi:hypothetical protein